GHHAGTQLQAGLVDAVGGLLVLVQQVRADLPGDVLDLLAALGRLLAIPVDPTGGDHAQDHPGDGAEAGGRPLHRRATDPPDGGSPDCGQRRTARAQDRGPRWGSAVAARRRAAADLRQVPATCQRRATYAGHSTSRTPVHDVNAQVTAYTTRRVVGKMARS